jgi:hypothetical protein
VLEIFKGQASSEKIIGEVMIMVIESCWVLLATERILFGGLIVVQIIAIGYC